MDNKRNIQKVGEHFVVSMMKGGLRTRITCHTFEEAVATRAKLELETEQQRADQWTISQSLKMVYDNVWKTGRNADGAMRNAQEAVDFFGKSTVLDAITTDKVDSWISRLRQIGNSNATINRKLAALSKLMSYARRRNKMATKPHFERQREGNKTNGRIRFLTRNEEGMLVESFEEKGLDCHAEAIKVLVDTGLRPSELWRLQARDLNLELGVLTIWQTKTDKPRTVPMSTRVREILKNRMENYPSGQLFPNSSNHWLIKEWNKVREAMGLTKDKEFIPYALRHTCASRLVQNNINPKVVMEWMGHSNLSMTDRYCHLNPQTLLDAARVMDRC